MAGPQESEGGLYQRMIVDPLLREVFTPVTRGHETFAQELPDGMTSMPIYLPDLGTNTQAAHWAPENESPDTYILASPGLNHDPSNQSTQWLHAAQELGYGLLVVANRNMANAPLDGNGNFARYGADGGLDLIATQQHAIREGMAPKFIFAGLSLGAAEALAAQGNTDVQPVGMWLAAPAVDVNGATIHFAPREFANIAESAENDVAAMEVLEEAMREAGNEWPVEVERPEGPFVSSKLLEKYPRASRLTIQTLARVGMRSAAKQAHIDLKTINHINQTRGRGLPPTLVLQSPEDEWTPAHLAAKFAGEHPDEVTLVWKEGHGHDREWNDGDLSYADDMVEFTERSILN